MNLYRRYNVLRGMLVRFFHKLYKDVEATIAQNRDIAQAVLDNDLRAAIDKMEGHY